MLDYALIYIFYILYLLILFVGWGTYSRCSLKEKSSSMLLMLPQVGTTPAGFWASEGERREVGEAAERSNWL